jgi:hypothetical protein
MRTIPDKFDAVSTLPAAEFNDFKNETLNLVDTVDITPSASDLYQVTKAVSIYSARGDFYNDTGSANAYLLAVSDSQKSPPAYVEGMRVRFQPANTNTTTSTVNVAGLGVKTLRNADGSRVVRTGEIPANKDVTIVYDGTYFRVVHVASDYGVTAQFSVDTIGGRIGLHPTNPIYTSNTFGGTVIYYIPMSTNQIALYNGTRWELLTTGTLSVAIPDTTGTNYDVFITYNSGVPSMILVPWGTDTARATFSVTRFQGVLTLATNTSTRYVGTIRTTNVAGQCEDSSRRRFVYNENNKIPKILGAFAPDADAWVGSETDFAIPEGNNTLGETRADIVIGGLDNINIQINTHLGSITNDGAVYLGFALDSQTVPTLNNSSKDYTNDFLAGTSIPLGYHYYQILYHVTAGPRTFGPYTLNGLVPL